MAMMITRVREMKKGGACRGARWTAQVAAARYYRLSVALAWALGLAAVGRAETPAVTPTNTYWFPVGEYLTYDISWGPFSVGETKVYSEWVEEEGRALLAIRVVSHSKSILDKIFPVDDFIESVVDPNTFLPVRFTKRLSEGRYRLHEVTTFDHRAGTAHWKHLLKDKAHDFAIEADTRDIVSFMFYMRAQRFTENTNVPYRVMADEKLYDLEVNAKKWETVSLPVFGKIKAMRLEPEAKFQGLFVRVGKLVVWVSNDARNLCAQATAKVPVGTVKATLMKVEGPGADDWSKKSAAQQASAPSAAGGPAGTNAAAGTPPDE